MVVKLIRIGEFGTHEFPIVDDELLIGRDPECGLRLDHGRVSRNHCRIQRRGDLVLVEDLGSTAGTAVNQQVLNRRFPPAELHHGDHLWVGPEHFRFAEEGLPPPPDLLDEVANPLIPEDIRVVQARAADQVVNRLTGQYRLPDRAVVFEEVPEGTLIKVGESRPGEPSVVQLLAKAVMTEAEATRLVEELAALVAQGKTRLVLTLDEVERVSGRALEGILKVAQRCLSAGGMLKLCKPRHPQVLALFSTMNLDHRIGIFPDVKHAVRGPWPRPLPAVVPDPAGESSRAHDAARLPRQVRLVVAAGRAKGRILEVRVPRYYIGRDPRCQLRPNDDTISRLHAIVEQREGKVWVRDLGSGGGTTLAGRILRGEEAEASHGESLEIGFLRFTFDITDPVEDPGSGAGVASPGEIFGESATDSSAATMLVPLPKLGEAPRARSAATIQIPLPKLDGMPSAATPKPSPPVPKRSQVLRSEVVRNTVCDAVVVTILTPHLVEETTLAPVRYELQSLLDQSVPRRVVVRFDHVVSLSKGAVVMLLARAQDLERAGGALRVCHVAPAVRAFLDQTQLPTLVDIYPTLDEAFQAAWA